MLSFEFNSNINIRRYENYDTDTKVMLLLSIWLKLIIWQLVDRGEVYYNGDHACEKQ